MDQLKAVFISLAFWLFPILTLIASNLGQFQILDSLRLMLFSVFMAMVSFFLSDKVFRSREKGFLFSCFLAISFSIYGHLYLQFENLRIGDYLIGRHRFLLIGFLLATACTTLLVYKIKNSTPSIVNLFIFLSIGLVFIPVYQISSEVIRQLISSPKINEDNKSQQSVMNLQDKMAYPDIYIFVLDGYGRSDFLKESFAYDNSHFLELLADFDFYVAECSQSNYTSTWYSVASMLNMVYLEDMPPLNGETRRVPSMVPYIMQSVVREKLESMGYKTVAFETGFGFTELKDADYYFQTSDKSMFNRITGRINAFELLYLRTTMASFVMDIADISDDEIEKAIKINRQDYIYSAFQNEVLEIDGPKFVFAHILTTHNPYVYPLKEFDSVPAVNQLGSRSRGYHDAVVYSDRMMSEIITKIVETSAIPPVIVITGDHGPSISKFPEKTVENLYAIKLGDNISSQLYPSITPVNTFRVIFDSVFNENYPLLPDRSYYIVNGKNDQFIPAVNNCP